MKKIFAIIMSLTILFLVACQTDNVTTYSVVFFTDTGISTPSATTPDFDITSKIPTLYNIQSGSFIERPADPVKSSSAFVGWFKDNKFTESWDFNVDIVERSMTLYAKWADQIFSISYVLNGGSITAGVKPALPLNYTLSTTELFISSANYYTLPVGANNRRFRGWYLDEALTISVTSIQPGKKVPSNEDYQFTGDLTLYARYYNF